MFRHVEDIEQALKEFETYRKLSKKEQKIVDDFRELYHETAENEGGLYDTLKKGDVKSVSGSMHADFKSGGGQLYKITLSRCGKKLIFLM